MKMCIVAVEHLQAFRHIAHSDAAYRLWNLVDGLAIDFYRTTVGEADTIVFDLDHDLAITQDAAQRNSPAFDFGRDAVFNAVLDQRLQDHAGHDRIHAFRIDLMHDPQLVFAKTDDFDVKIVLD